MTLAEQPAAEPPPPPEPPRPKRMWVAKFNEDGGLVGFDETTADKVPAGAVAFAHKPDNLCDGRYRWNDNQKRFDPIPVRLLELGDTAAFNNMVLSVLAGFVEENSVPIEVKDAVDFIRATGADDTEQLQRLVKAEGMRLLKRFKAQARHALNARRKQG